MAWGGACADCAEITHVESQLYSVSQGEWLECIRADRANVTVNLRRGEFFDAGEYESCGNVLIGVGNYRLKVRNFVF